MRVLIGIAECMVIPVHGGIGVRVKKRRTLADIGKDIKEPFPEFVHAEYFMRSIAVQEKCLAEQGKEPMPYKEKKDIHKKLLLVLY